MTIHQSKGLQFPIVVAADLGRTIRPPTQKVLYDRDAPGGVAVSVRGPTGWFDGSHYKDVQRVSKLRAEAEAARLFYVQVTRVRDHLVLSGGHARNGLRRRVVEPVAELLGPSYISRVGVPQEFEGGSEHVFTPRRFPVPLLETGQHCWDVSVTMLEEFARCPRRFAVRSTFGDIDVVAAQRSQTAKTNALRVVDGGRSRGTAIDARERGILLHTLLEDTEWSQLRAKGGRSALEAIWEMRLEASGLHEEAKDDVRRRLHALGQTRFAETLAGENVRVFREHPFSLKIPVSDGVVLVRGQIDLFVEFEHAVHIVDYKATSPAKQTPVAPYVFQLAAYALGYREVASQGQSPKEVRGGIWFVDGQSREPVYDDRTIGRALRDLPAIAQSFAKAMRTFKFDGRRIESCRAIHCPLVQQCHAVK